MQGTGQQKTGKSKGINKAQLDNSSLAAELPKVSKVTPIEVAKEVTDKSDFEKTHAENSNGTQDGGKELEGAVALLIDALEEEESKQLKEEEAPKEEDEQPEKQLYFRGQFDGHNA